MKLTSAPAFQLVLLLAMVAAFCAQSAQAQGPWTFKAASIFLDRGHPDGLVLMQDSAAPGRNLNAAALDLGWQHGWDIGGIRQGDDFDVEFEVMHINDWDGVTNAIVGPPSSVQINNVQPFSVIGVTSVLAVYESKMLSVEINRRDQITGNITFITGFRYMQLDENFQSSIFNAGPPAIYNTSTSNDLIGGQIGVDTWLVEIGRLSVDLTSKFGMYYNTAIQNTSLSSGAVSFNASDKDKGPAFIGEVELASVLEVTDNISIRLGYMLMWVESVALAPEQVVATNFTAGSGIDASGGAFYHGALLQLIMTR